MEQTRKLGRVETYFADRKRIINLNVPTLLKTKDIFLDVKILKEAVYKTIKSQPNLNTVIRRQKDGLYFSPLQEVRDYFEVLPKEADWKEVCIEYNNKHLREDFETFPPFKVLFIQPSSKEAILIAAGIHYAMDGVTALAVVSIILETYSELQKDAGYTPTHHKAARSMDDYIKEIISCEELAERKKNYLEYHLSVVDSVNCGMDFVNTSSTKTIFSHYSSNESEFIDFKKICKAKEFTVGAALCGAFAFAMARCIFNKNKDAENLPETINLIFGLPVNLRNRATKLSWKCVNLMASTPYISVSVNKFSSFWEVVQNVKKSFDYVLSEDTKFYLFSSLTICEELATEDAKGRIEAAKQKMNGLSKHGYFSNMKT